MKTKFGIPQDQLDEIVLRDEVCVYCQKEMINPFDIHNRSNSATIEHLNHRADWYSVQDFVGRGLSVHSIITICCGGCNSSRGAKPLRRWLESRYCKSRNINVDTVSPIVQRYIEKYEP